MQKLGCLIVVCALAGALFGLGKVGLSAYNEHTNLTKKLLKKMLKLKLSTFIM